MERVCIVLRRLEQIYDILPRTHKSMTFDASIECALLFKVVSSVGCGMLVL